MFEILKLKNNCIFITFAVVGRWPVKRFLAFTGGLWADLARTGERLGLFYPMKKFEQCIFNVIYN